MARLRQQQSRGFRAKPWADIREFLSSMAAQSEDFSYLVEVIDSIQESGHAKDLRATTSMHDLIVADVTALEPPFDVIVVRAPGSLRSPAPGNVAIEHLSLSGHDDRIERPAAEAVPLFWRFVSEKFGIAALPPQTD